MFDIPPGNAEQTLKLYSSQSAREVIFATSTTGKIQTNRVKGDFTPSEALEQLLKNTGLIFKRDEASGILSVTRDPGNRRRGEPSANARPPGESQKKKPSEKTPQNQYPMKKNSLLARLAAALAWIAAPAYMQTAPTGAANNQPPVAEKVIELTPFEVTADQDVGYLAANTLAGSRMNTPLKDTAASISVFTREFMNDLAATDMAEVLAFGNNIQPEVGDAGSFGDGGSTNDTHMIFNPAYRVRGIPAELARNYFRWDVPADTYNVARVEDSRGPNSILFGIGSPGGIINVATKRAVLGRTIREGSLMTDEWGSLRATFDYNQPLGDKGALRLNALWGDQRSHVHHVFKRSKRLHLAGTYRFNPKWQARVEFENGKITETRGRNTAIADNVTPWLQSGRPTVSLTDPSSAIGALGVRQGANQSLRYISNTGQLIDTRGQVSTR
jgi:outer membrane receptor protein involved in Fe transport